MKQGGSPGHSGGGGGRGEAFPHRQEAGCHQEGGSERGCRLLNLHRRKLWPWPRISQRWMSSSTALGGKVFRYFEYILLLGMSTREAYLIVATRSLREASTSTYEACSGCARFHSHSHILLDTSYIQTIAPLVPDGGSIINMSSVCGSIKGAPNRQSLA